MNIEYAYFSTIEEIEKRNKFFKSKTNNKEIGIKYLIENELYIVKSHEEYLRQFNIEKYNKYVEQLHSQYKNALFKYQLTQSIINGDINYCQCGSELKIVEGYNFIGCTNFRAIGLHDTYQITEEPELIILPLEDYIEKNDVKPNQQYLADFKKKYNIPEFVSASNIIQFFSLKNIELHNKEIDLNKFQKVSATSSIANSQEVIIKNILKKHFEKVLYQQHITYKEINNTEKFCIPDYICGGKESNLVYCIDLKKSTDSSNLERLNLYHELLEKIFKGRNKIIKSFQLFFEPRENDNLDYHRGFYLSQLQDIL